MLLLGYNTNGFMCHSLHDAIRVIADLGYRCVGITLDHCALNPFEESFDRQARETRTLLEHCGLTSVIETGARFLLDPWRKHWPTLLSEGREDRLTRLSFLKKAVDAAHLLGSGCVSFWSGKKEPAVESDRAWDWLVSSCRELSGYAMERGVTLAFEPEPGMWIENMSQYRELRRDVDHRCFRLTLDVGHAFLTEEGTVGDCIREHREEVENIHIEDMSRGVHEHRFFGEGEMDFGEILGALEETHYRGPICVELSRHSHDAVSTARRSREFLQGWLAGNVRGSVKNSYRVHGESQR